MPLYGSVVVIRGSGADGSIFPLINEVQRQTDFLTPDQGVCSGKSGRLRHQDPAARRQQGTRQAESEAR